MIIVFVGITIYNLREKSFINEMVYNRKSGRLQRVLKCVPIHCLKWIEAGNYFFPKTAKTNGKEDVNY